MIYFLLFFDCNLFKKDNWGQNSKKMKNVKKKQEKLKFWISKFGWSQNEFARSFYVANNETDVETEIKSFEEKFKKHLSRTTTKE